MGSVDKPMVSFWRRYVNRPLDESDVISLQRKGLYFEVLKLGWHSLERSHLINGGDNGLPCFTSNGDFCRFNEFLHLLKLF